MIDLRHGKQSFRHVRRTGGAPEDNGDFRMGLFQKLGGGKRGAKAWRPGPIGTAIFSLESLFPSLFNYFRIRRRGEGKKIGSQFPAGFDV